MSLYDVDQNFKSDSQPEPRTVADSGVFPRDHDLIMINNRAQLVMHSFSTWMAILFLCATSGVLA